MRPARWKTSSAAPSPMVIAPGSMKAARQLHSEASPAATIGPSATPMLPANGAAARAGMLHHPGESHRVIDGAGQSQQRQRGFQLPSVLRESTEDARGAEPEETQHQHFGLADAVGEQARQGRAQSHQHGAQGP